MDQVKIIKDIIKKKQSNICLAADVETVENLFKLIEQVGDKICILKIHYDIIEDFFLDYYHTSSKLRDYKKKYNFLIWEDSKFGDIGYILIKKISNHIIKWADLISIHPIGGIMSVNQIKGIGIILIGELSCQDHLINLEYQNKVIEISEKCDNIVGIVCQHKMTDNLLNITPGISLNKKIDNLGQQYSSPEDKLFSDIFVIGRDIYLDKNPKNKLDKILNKQKKNIL